MTLLGQADVIQADLIVAAPEEHGQKPPGTGEEPPSVVIETDGTRGASATFQLSTAVAEKDVGFECQLTVDDVPGPWTDCTTADGGRATYQDLAPAKYTFAARATDRQGNTSPVVQLRWTSRRSQVRTPRRSGPQTADTTPLPDGDAARHPAGAQRSRPQARASDPVLRYLTRDLVQFYGSVLPRHDGAKPQRRTTAGYRTVARVTLRRATQHRSEYRRTSGTPRRARIASSYRATRNTAQPPSAW